MPLDLPEPHATNAMCAEFDGWTHVHLSIDGDVVWGLPPGPGKFQITVPNFPEDALACASLLPALMPKLAERVGHLMLGCLQGQFCAALVAGNHPAFCALVIEAVRKVQP